MKRDDDIYLDAKSGGIQIFQESEILGVVHNNYGEKIKNTFLNSLGVVGCLVPKSFCWESWSIAREVRGSNTRWAWERGEFAVSFIFSHNNLIEVLGISKDFSFLFIQNENKGIGIYLG